MQTCPVCNTPNRDEARFCASCGTPLQAAPPAPVEPLLTCPACGAQNESDARFCGACGAALEQTPAPAPEAEPLPQSVPELAEAPEEASESPMRPPGEPAPSVVPIPEAAPTSPAGIRCSACGTVIRYCPSCGAPLHEEVHES
jgi:hypothetical protein